MVTTNEFIIQTSGLSKFFGETKALVSLDLKVPRNSIFGFLGPNGAGKTTTMKLLLGQIKPTSGSATIFGQDIVNESISIRQRIGFLPQEIRFYEYMTAREILNFTMRFYYSGPKNLIKQRVDEILMLVGLENIADRPVKGFSGGERQRLGLGQAEVNHPELLILDEPAASLDPLGRRGLLKVMKNISKDTTIFFSTHILDDVQKISDTVAVLNKGKLITQGPIEEILKGGEGTVYTVKLKGADVDDLRSRLSAQSWISNIIAEQVADISEWQISVTDDGAAEDNLLGMVQAKGNKVLDYGEKKVELEDIFIKLVKEGGE
jgi:ABC-2 type transport system ATP-binding protein